MTTDSRGRTYWNVEHPEARLRLVVPVRTEDEARALAWRRWYGREADDRIRRSAARRVLGHRFRRAGRVDQKETEEMSPGTKAKRKKGSTKKCGVQICLGR